MATSIVQKDNDFYTEDGQLLNKKSWREIKRSVQEWLKAQEPAVEIVEAPPQYNEEDIRLTDLLHSLVSRNYPFVAAKPFGEKDYEEMNKIARLDKYPYKIIEAVIVWSQEDEFWKQNIRSVQKLRKQFDKLLIKAKAEYEKRQKQTSGVV